MKTLVIHPEDRSTDFLKHVYAPLKEYTLIRSGDRKRVHAEIKNHDRIFMLGHGSQLGLLSVRQFEGIYVVDAQTVPLLRGKECVFIWCNADVFVNNHRLKGFFSGMFVSELVEAYMMGIPHATNRQVEESNDHFAKAVGLGLMRGLYHAYHQMMTTYEQLAQKNIVEHYNAERLYLVL